MHLPTQTSICIIKGKKRVFVFDFVFFFTTECHTLGQATYPGILGQPKTNQWIFSWTFCFMLYGLVLLGGGCIGACLFICFLFLRERDKKTIKLGRYGGREDLGRINMKYDQNTLCKKILKILIKINK